MKDLVSTGPFLSASLALDRLTTGLYFSQLLRETVAQQEQFEQELKIARALGDEDLIKQCESDLAIIERAYQVTAMLDANDLVQ